LKFGFLIGTTFFLVELPCRALSSIPFGARDGSTVHRNIAGLRAQPQRDSDTVGLLGTIQSLASEIGKPTSACLRTDTIYSKENFFFIGNTSSPFLGLALPKY
jgi:hypothetical protein